MSFQKIFQIFHKNIKVETEELREKRDIIMDKIKISIENDRHPIPVLKNQGSYRYGVGIKPLKGYEYDIDVGLFFPINFVKYRPIEIRSWVYDAIKLHTNDVENRGPCIRVRYAAGYHIDLVIYAQSSDTEDENYQLARNDDVWLLSQPKLLKEYIWGARQKFLITKDENGADQLQRVTRYLKRWNDLDIPGDSPDKPCGLATLMLVINLLITPVLDGNGVSDDLEALILVCREASKLGERVSINKPTSPYEDLFEKLNDKAMKRFKERLLNLLEDLEQCKRKSEEEALCIISSHFGSDFPTLNNDKKADKDKSDLIEDMKKAIPNFKNPAKPWSN